jgi:hypothetical protein
MNAPQAPATSLGMPPFPSRPGRPWPTPSCGATSPTATGTIRAKRALVIDELDDWEGLRQRAARIKDDTLAHLDEHLQVATAHGIREVAKVKSMATRRSSSTGPWRGAGDLGVGDRELLLMVQNSLYADALATGKAQAAEENEPLAALMALLTPIVACNRSHAENGRVYLREMAFGARSDHHRMVALGIAAQTSDAVAATMVRTGLANPADAEALAGLVEGRVFLAMAGSGPDVSTADVVNLVARSIEVLVRHQPAL